MLEVFQKGIPDDMKMWSQQRSGTWAAGECVTDVFTTVWCLLGSITEQTHGNIESICFIQWLEKKKDRYTYLPRIACDHALSLYLCTLFSGGGHDTFLSQITCKKARIWTFFWLDRKQYGWFALFRLAKMPPSVSCCWFQSAFLLA